MRFRHPIGFLLVLLFVALPGYAQLPPSPRMGPKKIDGFVRDYVSQQGMDNVRVDLVEASGNPAGTLFTQSNGEFVFDGLRNGSYVLIIEVKDYEPVREPVMIQDEDVRSVAILLRRPLEVGNRTSGPMISAHQLSVPHKAFDEYEKGMNDLNKPDYQGAIAQFQLAIKDFPTYYEAYAEEGRAYGHLGQTVPAEEALRKSVDLSSGQYFEALLGLSGLLADTNRYTEAVTFARKAIDVDAASWRGPYELARDLMGLKQMDEAETSAIQAKNMKPDNPSVYLMLANIYMQESKYPALISDLDVYLKLTPVGDDADQARKIRDQARTNIEQMESQARANAQKASHPEAQNSPAVAAPPPPPAPDTSGLTSLPPPAPSNE